MEEPSSPISPHLLNHGHGHGAASPYASPGAAYPDVCLLPRAHAPLPARLVGASYGLPHPRTSGGGFVPSSLRRPQGIDVSFKENGDQISENMAALTTNNTLLQVDSHLYPPASSWNNNSQPITPSPRALHDNSSQRGWKVPDGSLEKISGSFNDLGAEGRRIGYDGTTQTPSVQLLKPTASSLGHRVSKPPIRPQPMISPPRSLQSNPYGSESPKEQNDVPSGDNQLGKASQMSNLLFNTPASSPAMDPFEKLKQSDHNMTSDDDTEMEEKNSSHGLLEEFDAFDMDTGEDPDRNFHQPPGFSNYLSKMPRPPQKGFQRSSSWSPGCGNRGFNSSPERLRSYNMDPVASQLLKACAVNEEEQEEEIVDQLSRSENVNGRARRSRGGGGRGWRPISCRSPTLPSNNDNCSNNGRSLSMSSLPNVVNPTPSTLMRQGSVGRGSKVSPMITEGAPLNYPLSPRVPLFGDSSGSLGEVAEEDAKSLARPVPRKFGSMPTLFMSSPSRSSF